MKKLVVVASIVCGALPAHAISTPVTFCFEGYGVYEDNWDNRSSLANGTREDYFTDDDPKPLRGFYVIISEDGVIEWQGYTGDGLNSTVAGCTPPVNLRGLPPYDVTFAIQTRALSQTHRIDAIDRDRLSSHWSTSIFSVSVPASPPNPMTVTWMPLDTITRRTVAALNVASFAAYRHYGGRSGGWFQLVTESNTDSCNQSIPAGYDRRLDVIGGNSRKKFLVAHEMGHCILKYRKPEHIYSDCEFVDSLCPANQGTADHSPGSNETQNCAFLEGFAHFYATDVFNSHNYRQAVFNYYTPEFGGKQYPSIDIPIISAFDQSVNGFYPRQYLEHECSPSYRTDHATELDWMRVLWEMHTYPTPVSFNEMTNWIDDADFGYSQTSAHDSLDWTAYWSGGHLWNAWNWASSYQGVDN